MSPFEWILPFIITAAIVVECRILVWYDRTHPYKKENADV